MAKKTREEVLDGMVRVMGETIKDLEPGMIREGVTAALDNFDKMMDIPNEWLDTVKPKIENSDGDPVGMIRETIVASIMSISLMFFMKEHALSQGKNSYRALREGQKLYELAKAIGDDAIFTVS
jgi:hypothetical protein